MQPSHDFSGAALAGTTSATGFPNLVTRIGWRVRRTSSITARQVDLNFETAISRTPDLYHSQRPWCNLQWDLPMVAGPWRPAILIPARLLEELEDDTLTLPASPGSPEESLDQRRGREFLEEITKLTGGAPITYYGK